MSKRLISCILAINNLNVIGSAGDAPWHLPDDLARFKRITSGNWIVIDERTHNSIQQFYDRAVREHDRLVKEKWEWFEQERQLVLDQGLSAGKQQRKLAQLEYVRDESLNKIPLVHLPFSLPGRVTVVVSETMAAPQGNPNLYVVGSVEQAIVMWKAEGKGNLYCAGGAELYHAFWDKMELVHITIVNNNEPGEQTFPLSLSGPEWRMVAIQKQPRPDAEGNATTVTSHTFIILQRKVQCAETTFGGIMP